MKTIGFRVSPKTIVFAIFDSASNDITTVDELKVPQAIPLPEQLKYIRFSVLDLIREYGASVAGIREIESAAMGNNTARVQLESIILEAFASSDLEAYRVGQIASISKWVGMPREKFLPYVNGDEDFEDVENWSTLKKEEREAVLVSIGAARDSEI